MFSFLLDIVFRKNQSCDFLEPACARNRATMVLTDPPIYFLLYNIAFMPRKLLYNEERHVRLYPRHQHHHRDLPLVQQWCTPIMSQNMALEARSKEDRGINAIYIVFTGCWLSKWNNWLYLMHTVALTEYTHGSFSIYYSFTSCSHQIITFIKTWIILKPFLQISLNNYNSL